MFCDPIKNDVELLQIYSGNDRIGTVSGVIKHQQRFVSPGNHLTVIFESDQFEERAGLVAHFRTREFFLYLSLNF